uniref:Ribonuclease H-like domain-containing protein n=1 Tax=Tanacetum cinerariifolium TaxID=118510 RepID=A0A6L2MPU7_TANCI|nr:ribonuclease H-like domain-containing protein [Tanacetum cinerariifolium]
MSSSLPQICNHFDKGSCKFSDRCKFIHDDRNRAGLSSQNYGSGNNNRMSATNNYPTPRSNWTPPGPFNNRVAQVYSQPISYSRPAQHGLLHQVLAQQAFVQQVQAQPLVQLPLMAQQVALQRHFYQHLHQGILGPTPTHYGSQAISIPSAFSTMTLLDPTWHMDTCASFHLNFNASNLSTIFNKRLFPPVQRSLYGLKQAPHAWFQRFVAYLIIYMDEIILTASSLALLQQIIDSLHHDFDMTDLEALNYFLGISADRNSTRLFLSQRKYALQLLEHAHMLHCNPFRTPIDTESKLGPEGVPLQVCLYMHDSREPHYAALKRILRYVRGAMDFGLHTTSPVGYTNADWAGYPSTRSAEAEYHGVANVIVETAWLCYLLRELHSPLSTATLFYCDNVNVVYMYTNPVQHQRTKHVEIDIHFVHDMVIDGQVRVSMYLLATSMLTSSSKDLLQLCLKIFDSV